MNQQNTKRKLPPDNIPPTGEDPLKKKKQIQYILDLWYHPGCYNFLPDDPRCKQLRY